MAGPWEKYANSPGPWQAYATSASTAPAAEPPVDDSVAKRVIGGAVEPNLALLTGSVATPVAGLAGLAAAPFVGAEKAGDVVKSVQKGLTYEPKTQGGKAAMEVIGAPFEKLGEAAQAAGRQVQDITGSPALAAVTQTIIEAVPQLFAAKGAGKVGEIPSIKEMAGVKAAPLTKEQRALQEVRQEGYRVSPTQARPSIINDLLEGWAGQAAAAKEMSIKNQPITNAKIKQGLGIPKDTDLDYSAIDTVIEREGQKYNAVREVPIELKLNDNFVKQADDLLGGATEAAKRWPDRFKLPEVETLRNDMLKAEGASPNDVIDLVRRLRKDSSYLLKTMDDPNKAAVGEAYRRAADSLDDLLDRNLKEAGHRDLVSDYQRARRTIAQAYDVRSATNDFTGNVDAVKLKKLSEKRPFTDFLKDIAQAASVSKRTMRTPEQVGGHPGLSSLEGSIAAAEALSGKLPASSAFLLRPLIAKIISSEPYQKRFVDRAQPKQSDLAKRIVQLLTAEGANATEER